MLFLELLKLADKILEKFNQHFAEISGVICPNTLKNLLKFLMNFN